jgi:5-methylcytosine-specific restriction endonuclease McrA
MQYYDNGLLYNRIGSTRRKRLIKFLKERDGLTCWICFKPFMPDKKATIDHIIPKCLGGTNDVRNLALAHPLCNNRRPLLKFALKEWPEKERTI